MRSTLSTCSILATALMGAAPLVAGSGGADRIAVIAQVLVPDGPVVQITAGTHRRRNFVYLRHGPPGGSAITVLDVTDPTVPKAAANLDAPPPEALGSITAVVGNAVLVASPTSPQPPQTITILNFADLEHPKVARQFPGVTALLKDAGRGLIYLTDSKTLWVLHPDPATDIDLEKQYEHHVLYSH